MPQKILSHHATSNGTEAEEHRTCFLVPKIALGPQGDDDTCPRNAGHANTAGSAPRRMIFATHLIQVPLAGDTHYRGLHETSTCSRRSSNPCFREPIRIEGHRALKHNAHQAFADAFQKRRFDGTGFPCAVMIKSCDMLNGASLEARWASLSDEMCCIDFKARSNLDTYATLRRYSRDRSWCGSPACA